MSRRLVLFLLAAASLVTHSAGGAPVQPPPERIDALGDLLPPHALLRIGTVRFRHGDVVNALVVAPDGKTVISAGRDNTIRVWDLATGKELRHWRGQDEPAGNSGVAALALTRDGKRLASGSAGDKIRLWEPTTGRLVRTLELRFSPSSFLSFLDDNVTLLIHRERTIHLINAATGEERSTFRLEDGEEDRGRRVKDELLSFALSPDGSLLLTGQTSGTVRLWDVGIGKPLQRLDGDSDPISVAAFSADNQVYAWGTSKGRLTIGKVSDDKALRLTPDGNRWIDALAFSPDGKHLACGGGGGVVTIFAVDTGKELRRIDAHADGITCLAFTPDGNTLVSGGYDSCIRVWNVRSGEETVPTSDHRGRVVVALSADGSRLATAGVHQPIHCWDAATGKVLRSFALGNEHSSPGVVFSAAGDRLSAVCAGALRSWDLETGRELRHVYLGRDFEQAALSPDGRVVTGRTGTPYLALYQASTRRRLRVPGSKALDGVYRVAISPDSKWVGTLRSSGQVQVWDAATAKEVAHFKAPSRVFHFTFTSDKNLIITLSVRAPGEPHGDRIARWVLQAGAPLLPFEGDQGDPVSLAVSPDGKTLVTADEAGPLRLWEVATGKPRGVLKGHQGAVVSLAFSADGKQMLSGSRDTTALLWDLPAVAAGERPAARELTANDLDVLWADLRSDDAAVAYRAVTVLAASPRQSIPYLRWRLQPASTDQERLAQLVADLDSTIFETRQQAHAELAELADLAEPILRATQKDPPSAEVRRLVEDLLDKAKMSPYVLTGERLRAWRALEALESSGTREACEVLAMLAKGDEPARLTREARCALNRVQKRGVAAK